MCDLFKKCLICCVVLACLCGFGWLVWIHRGMLRALICGEPLPEAPEGCPMHREENEESK